MTRTYDDVTPVQVLKDAVRQFMLGRDRLTTPKQLSMALVVEASGLMELYQWPVRPSEEEVIKRLADVITCCLALADVLDVDVASTLWDRMEE